MSMIPSEFNDLVYTASESLKSPALKYTRNEEDANDLIQDTVLKALRNKSKFQQGSNIKAWLYIIMKNTFISKYNKTRRSVYVDPVEDSYTFTSKGNTDSNKGAGNLVLDDINSALQKLDENLKRPFMMHFSGFKYEEIAEELSIPLGTVKNRIHVARKMLMADLQDYK
ncbi:sigma-70 family RNA polymerase sigma factor [Cytophagaceae bacterium ABcell3]|nr:sigma-70 family RNA polymerase sigma factor [Cytophagaceae bacterium ABcell3]